MLRSASQIPIGARICLCTWYPACTRLPFRAPALHTCPHSSVIPQYRNLHLLSIGYDSRPRLRPRLTQGRSALPWKPWIFGLEDSHLYLATHSGILSSIQSTAPYGTASFRMQCSSTNSVYHTSIMMHTVLMRDEVQGNARRRSPLRRVR